MKKRVKKIQWFVFTHWYFALFLVILGIKSKSYCHDGVGGGDGRPVFNL